MKRVGPIAPVASEGERLLSLSVRPANERPPTIVGPPAAFAGPPAGARSSGPAGLSAPLRTAASYAASASLLAATIAGLAGRGPRRTAALAGPRSPPARSAGGGAPRPGGAGPAAP